MALGLLSSRRRTSSRSPGRRRRKASTQGAASDPTGQETPSGIARQVRRSIAARVVVLPIGAAAAFVAIRLVIGEVGTEGFAIYALVAGVAGLLPVADLGIGAAVTDAAARRGQMGTVEYRGVLVASLRTLVASAAVVASVGWIGAALGLWASVFGLGTSRTADLGVALVATLVAINLPLSIGVRLLIGSGDNPKVVALNGLAPVFALAVLSVLILVGAPTWMFPGSPFAGYVIASALALLRAARRELVDVARLVRAAVARATPTSAIRMFALPMLVIQATAPLTFQTDRIVLNWVSSLETVAQYSLVAPLYIAAYSVVAASAGAMWAHFSRTRSFHLPTRSEMLRLVAGLAAMGGSLGVGIVVAGPLVVRFMSGDAEAVPTLVYVTFAAALVTHATWLPFATLYTDPSGLRFQAIGTTAMAAVNLAAALVLAQVIGAAGPPLATVVALTTALIVPGLLRFRRLSNSPTLADRSRPKRGLPLP